MATIAKENPRKLNIFRSICKIFVCQRFVFTRIEGIGLVFSAGIGEMKFIDCGV